MGHRPEDGDAPPLAGEHVAGSGRSGEIARPSRFHPGVRAVCPPGREVHDAAPSGRVDAAGRFGGQKCAEVELVDHESFDDLALDQGCRDLENGFVDEEHRAFGHRENVPLEAHGGEKAEEVPRKKARRPEVGELFPGEPEGLEVFEHFFEPRRDEIASVRWIGPHEEAEGGGLVHAALEIHRGHGELVEVGEKGGSGRPRRSIWHDSEISKCRKIRHGVPSFP
ncbi:MAG: hypothetical protein KatS3mg076_0656 [Candidatus Binatia bacterium]|nr:MAG: hypothetical protein KatS3mg076_0656 [Candidatus Binatia bacterium]